MEASNKPPLCRLCLHDDQRLIYIFQKHPGQMYVPAKVIQDLLQIQVSKMDGYPPFACLRCFEKLSDIRQFREQCLQSIAIYDSLLSKELFHQGYPNPMQVPLAAQQSQTGTGDSPGQQAPTGSGMPLVQGTNLCPEPEKGEIAHNQLFLLNSNNCQHMENQDNGEVWLPDKASSDGCEEHPLKGNPLETNNASSDGCEEHPHEGDPSEESLAIVKEELEESMNTGESNEEPLAIVKEELEESIISGEFNEMPKDPGMTQLPAAQENSERMDGDFEFVTSNRGRPLLAHKGYLYNKERINRVGIMYYKCTQYYSNKCCGRALLSDNRVVLTGAHNHTPNAMEVGVRRAMEVVRRKAIETQDSPANIISEAVTGMSDALIGALPSKSLLHRTVERRRTREKPDLANPHSLLELEVPLNLRTLPSQEDFLKFDSGPGQSRFLIFSTERNLASLQRSQSWFADGTFSVTALPTFTHLYTIHCVHEHTVVAAVYVLMSGKTQEQYDAVMHALQVLCPQSSPHSIMMDFDHAAMNAFSQTFPLTKLQGSYFHFSQCLWRKLESLPHLRERYIADVKFSVYIRMLAGLAFIPRGDVVERYVELRQTPFFLDNADLLGEFLAYFECTWVGIPEANGQVRHPPQFPIGIWNVHEEVLRDWGKMNNAVEGWHRGFAALITFKYPTIWRLLEVLIKQQVLNAPCIEQINAGLPPLPGKRFYGKTAEKIRQMVVHYEMHRNRPIDQHLLSITPCLVL